MNALERSSRQGFLGAGSQERLARARIGVIGLGGGGSHVIQQLTHLGCERLMGFDHDRIEESNLNRVVGGRSSDVTAKMLKVDIAERLVRELNPEARFEKRPCRWQERPEDLARCDLVIGCVDGFAERDQLEAFARKHLIPYVDIGLDVHAAQGEGPQMAGQIILSMPGHPCMRCLRFIRDERLKQEAERYGAAGPRAQVVWANGVLASTAVGIVVELITGWSGATEAPIYLSYQANRMTMTPHIQMNYLRTAQCPHYPIQEVGAARFVAI